MMKKGISIFLALILSVIPLTVGFAATAAEGETNAAFGLDANTYPKASGGDIVDNLRVNYEKEPNCVDGLPLFSWNLISSVRGARQTAYHVRVAESEEMLNAGTLLWDSGEIASAQCVGIACGGTLREARRYYWNVAVTNERGETVTSQTSSFVTALTETGFDGAAWISQVLPEQLEFDLHGANWIWQSDEANKGQHTFAVIVEWFRTLLSKIATFFVDRGIAQFLRDRFPAPYEDVVYFRREFTVDRPVATAYVAFTADDFGELYCNGQSVVSRQEAEGWQKICVKNVTDLIKQGKNAVAACADNEGGQGAMIAKLVIRYEDGTTQEIVTDKDWRASKYAWANWNKTSALSSNYKAVDYVEAYGASPWNETARVDLALPAPLLRKNFFVKDDLVSAKLYATAAGLYDAYLNGERVTDSVMNPGETQIDRRVQYQCFDVTVLLRSGENAIGAMLGNGWYLGARDSFGGKVPAFLCKLVLDYGDGSRETVVSDGSWTFASEGPILFNDIFDGETYDARDEIENWACADFEETWQNVRVTDAQALGVGAITPQVSGLVKVMDRLSAQSVNKVADKTYIYDFGQNLAGVASLRFKAKADTEITLRYGEMLNDGNTGSDGPAGTLYTANLRSAKATDHYFCKGDANGETYTPRFTFHGFRYLEITGLSEPLPLTDVTALVWYSDMEDTGTVCTSDALLNQLVKNTYWGQRSNFLSVPTDCPQRDERRGWTGDAQIFCGTAAYNMNVKTFFDKYITDMTDGQGANGAFSSIAPSTERVGQDITGNNGWTDALVIIPWVMYTRYGDRSYLEKYFNNMIRYAEHLIATSDGYIRSCSAFGDWLSIGESTDMAVVDTAYCVYVMDLMAKSAEVLGRTDDAERFTAEAENYRNAWCNRFVIGSGKLINDSQTAYLLALGFDLLPETDRQAFADTLDRKIRANGNRLTTGFLGCPLLLPVLCRFGHTDTAFALLQQEAFPSWKYPILQGATTIWERWNSYTLADGFGDVGMNSFNHYSYGSVCEWIYDTLVGIKADETAPGFSHFILRPTCGGGLTHAEGSYLSVNGLIQSAWDAEADVMTAYRCAVPANTAATLYLPAANAEAVTESGKALTEAEGITVVSSAGGTVELLLNSGVYDFLISAT